MSGKRICQTGRLISFPSRIEKAFPNGVTDWVGG